MRSSVLTASRLSQLVVGIGLLRAPAAVVAQGSDSVPQQEVWNFAVPETPATSYLDAGTTTISRPLTARDLATELVNLVDSSGHVKQGFAIAFTPSYLLGHRIPLDKYRRTGPYALANTQLSLAAVRSSGDSASTEVAFGVRIIFMDGSDPMRDREFTSALDSVMRECEPGDEAPVAGNVVTNDDRARVAEAFETCAQPGADKLLSGFLAGHWNASSFGIGAATGVMFEDSKFSQVSSTGVAGWAAGSIQLGRSGLIVGQIKLESRRPPDGSGSTTLLRQGARMVFGGSSVNFFAELSGDTRIGGKKGDHSGGRWTGGVEFKAGSEIWIATGFGSDFKPDEADRVVILANLRWVISKNSRFSPVPKQE
jgi:hypothetical protein